MQKMYSLLKLPVRIWFLAVACLLTAAAGAQTIYVDSAATGANNGTSWTNAYTQLSDAIAATRADATINTILVAKGTYYPTGGQGSTVRDSAFTITRSDISILGGYPAGGGARNVAANTTYLDGNTSGPAITTDNSYHIMVIAGLPASTDSIIVDGFTFRNGYSNGVGSKSYNGQSVNRQYGAAVYLERNDLGIPIVFNNCSFINNTGTAGGGALVNSMSKAIVTNSRFTNNTVTAGNGGACFQGGGQMQLSNDVFEGNTAASGGAIRKESNASFAIINTVFTNNRSTNGGGAVSITTSGGILVNNLFIGNRDLGPGGGAINTNTGNYTITNNTFYADSTNGSGGALCMDGTGNSTLNNNLFYKCVAAAANDYYSTGLVTLTQNNNGTGTIPKFLDEYLPAGADGVWGTADDGLQLTACGAGFNAGGNPWLLPGINTDFAGNPRIQFTNVDQGAYELQTTSTGNVLYVDGSIAVSGGGRSWMSAYKTLSEALTDAAHCPFVDSILVAKGTYYPAGQQGAIDMDSAFTIFRGGLKLYGGYPSGGGVRDSKTNIVYLDGNIGYPDRTYDNSTHIMVVAGIGAGADSVVINGFRFRNGYAYSTGSRNYNGKTVSRYYGAGLYLESNDLSVPIAIVDCEFTKNSAHWGGLAMVSSFSRALVINTTFLNNQRESIGEGALFQNGGIVSLQNSSFIVNSSGFGGAIRAENNPDLTAINCLFNGNLSVGGGGAVSLVGGSARLFNNVFCGNLSVAGSATSGGGAVDMDGGNFTIINNTFYSNTGDNGSALRMNGVGDCRLYNNIFYKNKGAGSNVQDVLNEGTMTYTQSYNRFSVEDPGFVNEYDPDGADNTWGTPDDGFALKICSPAINSGDNTASLPEISTDALGQARIQLGTVDLGAYEQNNAFSLNTVEGELGVNSICAANGWTHTYNTTGNRLIISVENGDNDLGGIGAKSELRTGYNSGSTSMLSTPFGQPGYYHPFNRSWTAFTLNDPVDSVAVRFYFTFTDSSDVKGAINFDRLSDLVLYKVDGTDAYNKNATGYGEYAYAAAASTTTYTFGTYQGLQYAEFYVTSFGSGTMAMVSSSSLPLDLLQFTGKLTGDKTQLQWTTAHEKQVSRFEIERSTDGSTWSRIGQLPAKNGAGDQSYEWYDNHPANGVNYYRLRMVDIDEQYGFSKIAIVKTNTAVTAMYPNPNRGEFFVDNTGGPALLQLFDLSGRSVHAQKLSQGVNRVQASALKAGVYTLKVDGETQHYIQKIVVAK